ncbi:hypothetical protein BH10ACT3_BH10ACT3_14920 [soil metagenome]
MDADGTVCRVCGRPTVACGERTTTFSPAHRFEFSHCEACGYTQIDTPRTDFADLYDEAYYAGAGADPMTDYRAELSDDRSIRRYEWAALSQIVAELNGGDPTTTWLDMGCGLGGSVRYARAHTRLEAFGFDEGFAGDTLAAEGVAHLTKDDLATSQGRFDVITAIDVIEHVMDPVEFLEQIRDLLRPGGTLFLTTGNAEPYRDRVTTWSYSSVPEVHIGFFEPRTLRLAYERAGLVALSEKPPTAFRDLLRYKVLKNLRVNRQAWWERSIPWSLAAPVVDRKFRLSAMPMARRPPG